MGEVKVPAQDWNAEAAVLGSCLIDQAAARQACILLEAEDFYSEANRRVFSAVMYLASEHDYQGIDPVTVGARLRDMGQLDDVGGHTYITELASGKTPTSGHVEHYARIVRSCSLSRSISHAVRKVYDDETPDALSELSELVLLKEANRGRRLFDFREDLQPVVDEIMRTDITQVKTGFPYLDHKLNGLEPGELIAVGARTGGGKTALQTRLCLNMAMDGEECLYITSEMRVASLIRRILPQATNVQASSFRSRSLTQEQRASVPAGVAAMSSLPIKMMDKGRISIRDIRSAIVRSGCKVVFVDYLQRCKFSRAEKESTAIYDFMAEFKEILLDTGVIGFIACQLDRERDKNSTTPPVLRDFRGSSGIESEADTCLLLWKPPSSDLETKSDYIPPPSGSIRTELIIAKARNGLSDQKVYMDFDGGLVKFCESNINGPAEEKWHED